MVPFNSRRPGHWAVVREFPRAAPRLVALLLLAVLAGPACGPDGESGTEPGAAASPPNALAAPSGGSAERTVAMPDGRSVRLRSRAQRVFPASSSVVDFLVALAPPERLAALPEQALDYASVAGDPAAWASVPRFYVYLAETVIALAPDLVIVEPSQDRNTSARLRSAGLEVVELPEVRNWAEARATLLCVGELLELTPRAEALARELDQRVSRLRAEPGRRATLRALCYSNFGGAGWSAGSNTTIHEQIVLAGLRDAAAESGRVGHVQITFEELIALDPDLILVSKPLRGGDSTSGDFGGASQRVLESEPSLQSLRAVREERILALHPNLFATSSHNLVLGAEELAREVDRLLAREEPPAPGQPAGSRGERE